MKKIFEKFFQPKTTKDGKTVTNKLGYVIILGLIGLLLIMFSNIFTSEETPEQAKNQMEINTNQEEVQQQTSSNDVSTASEIKELELSYEKQLVEMLNKIQGVSEAEVMINLASTNVNIYEKNLITGTQTTDESDKNGGTRKVEDRTEESQVVFVRQGDREVPLLVRTDRPEVTGVFVVAKGADHATVKKWVVESVSRVLDVPTHRVSVMPKK